jgi:hypothetical protein
MKASAKAMIICVLTLNLVGLKALGSNIDNKELSGGSKEPSNSRDKVKLEESLSGSMRNQEELGKAITKNTRTTSLTTITVKSLLVSMSI